MADKAHKWSENVRGRYYVDKQCIASKFCVAAASRNFRMADGSHAFVFKQPSGEEEEECREALEGCPVDAIGDDGDAE
jgi:ferredoxin